MERDIKFLLKTNEDDRDCVKYIYFEENGDFYFPAACFGGIPKEEMETILQNYDEITTALTRDELVKLFEIDNKWHKDRAKEDKEFIQYIKDVLDSAKAQEIWEQVQAEERDYLADEYGFNRNDIMDIFYNYSLPYRDRAVICRVWDDTYSIGEDYVDECCNIDNWLEKYIDFERLGDDLAHDGNYFELDDGRIVEFNY